MSDLSQIDLGDPPEYRELSNRLMCASKEYTCDDCGEKIKKGTQYRRIAFLQDGNFEQIIRHEYCRGEIDWF